MKKITLLIFCFVVSIYTFSQSTFIAHAGGEDYDGLYDVIQAQDGNYIAMGYKGNQEGLYMVKFNGTGQQLWSKVITTNTFDEGIEMINTVDGGFAISGTLNDKMALSKFDAAGNLSWSKQYVEFAASNGSKVIQTSDGGYLIPGGSAVSGTYFDQSYVVKTDAAGNVEWSKRYFNAPRKAIIDIKKTIDNNYVFLAYSDDGSDSAFVVKITNTGTVVWAKSFYSANTDILGFSLLATTDGGYIITGIADIYSSPGTNGFIFKINATGNLEWSKVSNVQTNGQGLYFFSTIQTDDGNYVIVGNGETASTGDFYYLLKFNSSGSVIWTMKTDAGEEDDYINTVIKTTDGGYLAVGSNFDEPFQSGRIIKFDANFKTCLPSVSYGELIDFGTLINVSVPSFISNTIASNSVITITNEGTMTNICTTLPLVLSEFTATSNNKTVQLKWKTSQEINTSYFELEKSNDGRAFNSFQQVSSAANINATQTYNSLDENPFKGDNWYRLKIVDKDGQYIYSKVAKVYVPASGSTVIYPNPAVDKVLLIFNAIKVSDYKITLTDISGKLLQTINGEAVAGENRIPVNVSKYAKGMYLINVKYDGSEKIVLKLYKQ